MQTLEDLQNRIDELEAALGLTNEFAMLPLTQSERRILGILYKRKAPSGQQLLAALGSRNCESPSLRTLHVMICKMRKKISSDPWNIKIETLRGYGGFYLTQETKQRLLNNYMIVEPTMKAAVAA
jgi:DNA-binding response OmpR family regulator